MNTKKLFYLLLVVSIPVGFFLAWPAKAEPAGNSQGECNEIVVFQTEKETVYRLDTTDLSARQIKDCERRIKDRKVKEESAKPPDFASGEILVKPRTDEGRKTVLETPGVKGLLKENKALGVLKLSVEPGHELEVIQGLKNNPNIEFAEPNFLAYQMDFPSWGQDAVGLGQATSVAHCDPNVVTAVSDTGVYSAHAELSGQILVGWNFISSTTDTSDPNGHGTAVVSTVIGKNVGICQGGSVIPYLVLNKDGWGTYDDIAASIISGSVDSRVKLMNFSLGGSSPSLTLEAAIKQAQASGKLIFAASGNALGEHPLYPAYYAATYDNVVAVGAVAKGWRLATWSNRFLGTESRSLVAPGVNITEAGTSCPSCYVSYSGTSMATPHVSGSAALIFSTNANLTYAQTRDLLLGNTTPLGDSMEYGRGGLNLAASVKAATGSPINLAPTVAWTIPWPALTALGNQVSVMAHLTDSDDVIASASASVVQPDGITISFSVAVNSQGLWEGSFTPSQLGVYTATVTAADSASAVVGMDSVNFKVVDANLPSGWPQHGRTSSGGSYITYTVDLATGQQIYSQWNDLLSSTDQDVVAMFGRGDAPQHTRTVSSPECPTGNDYGYRWLFDPSKGAHYAYFQVPFSDTVRLSCWDGAAVGMFPNSAAISGMDIALDEGSSRSDSQKSRLHGFDPVTGKQYWLTQLEYYADGSVALSEDGRIAYTVHGSDGMWAINAITGQRLWHFVLDRTSTWINAAPIVKGNTLYVKVSGNNANLWGLYALNAQTGQAIWRYNAGTDLNYDSEPALSTDGSLVIICDGKTTVHAVRALDGQLAWKTSLGTSYCDSTPAVTNQYVVQFIWSQTATDYNIYLKLLSLRDGSVVANQQVYTYGSAAGSPTVVGDLVFLADYSGWLRAYKIPTLQKVWEVQVDPYNTSSWQISAAIGEDGSGKYIVVFVSTVNGYFRAWKFRVNGVYATPTPGPSPTPLPSATNTQVPTLTATSTPTVTKTPIPTPSPTATPCLKPNGKPCPKG